MKTIKRYVMPNRRYEAKKAELEELIKDLASSSYKTLARDDSNGLECINAHETLIECGYMLKDLREINSEEDFKAYINDVNRGFYKIYKDEEYLGTFDEVTLRFFLQELDKAENPAPLDDVEPADIYCLFTEQELVSMIKRRGYRVEGTLVCNIM